MPANWKRTIYGWARNERPPQNLRNPERPQDDTPAGAISRRLGSLVMVDEQTAVDLLVLAEVSGRAVEDVVNQALREYIRKLEKLDTPPRRQAKDDIRSRLVGSSAITVGNTPAGA